MPRFLRPLPALLLPMLLLPMLLALPGPPASAQKDQQAQLSNIYDSSHGGASNDFDGTHTAASLNFSDPSGGAPHTGFSGGNLTIAGSFQYTPVLLTTSGVPYGSVSVEFTGAQFSNMNGGNLLLIAGYQNAAPPSNLPRSYVASLNGGAMDIESTTYNGANITTMGLTPYYSITAPASTDKCRFTFTRLPGLAGSSDLTETFTNLTTNTTWVNTRQSDFAMPAGTGLFGAGTFLANATISKLTVQNNFGAQTSYPITKSKVLLVRGDSLKYGSGSTSLGTTLGKNEASGVAALLGTSWQVFLYGEPGLTTGNFNNQSYADVAGYFAGYTDAAFVLAGGTNDLDAYVRSVAAGTPDSTNTPAAIFARLKAQCIEARALGATRIVLCTPLHSVQPASSGNTQAQNTALYATNADLLAGLIRTQSLGSANGNVADAIADYNAIGALSDPGGASAALFAGDGRHLTDAGYALEAGVDYNALAAADPAGVLPVTALSAADEAALVAAAGVPVTLNALRLTLGTPANLTLAGDIAAANTGIAANSAAIGLAQKTGQAVTLPTTVLGSADHTAIVADLAGVPAATVTAMKADSVLGRTFLRSYGKYSYNASTHVMSLLKDDGTPLLAADGTTPVIVTLGYDAASGTITSKQ